MANDLVALRASSVGPTGPAISEDALRHEIPVLFFAGEDDVFVEGSQQAANEARQGQFFAVPGADHMEACINVDFVGPRLKAFLDSVSVSGSA